ncbi:MAG: GNAT family N-acetyltransferase, partial [Halobacteriaceae archaeon]
MSINVEKHVIQPGHSEYLDEAWELKERIREQENVLKQSRRFFRNAYKRARDVVFVSGDNNVVGFITARTDGYILFLAVDPDYRQHGLGKRLVASIAENSRTVTCHARTTNEAALAFYEEIGFERVRRIDNYYEDGGDAFYLRLGENTNLL